MLFLAATVALGLLNVQLHPSGMLELRLARQEKLNALSPELLDLLREQAARAKVDAQVRGLMLTAEPGRAFCAGGDIKGVQALPLEEGRQFLAHEYELMLNLFELNQRMPVVALADGLVLGAGAGLFMAAGARVASVEQTSFAMPETALGIVPDCGGTDFLMSWPGQLGRWASLTGSRITAPMMAAKPPRAGPPRPTKA